MPSVFDLLEEIEKRPGLYIGPDASERPLQMRDLQVLLMGYGHALNQHGIEEPGATFLKSFGDYLYGRYHWSMSLGPILEIRRHAVSDDEAWHLMWALIWEFRTSLSTQ